MHCEHEGCHCTDAVVEREGKKFCSEACADSLLESTSSADCPCGHPDCAAI
jgi:hypothetical protein